jgi:Tfp pilus assembly protein PilW
MIYRTSGFSLAELMVAMMIALAMSTLLFHLFHQTERVVRDQSLVMEMQQTARVVAAQVADELRMAGQGVPIYPAKFDESASEAVSVILARSTSDRIDFRAELSNVQTSVTTPGPVDLTVGVAQSLSVRDGSAFTAGKFAYVSDESVWMRGLINYASRTMLTITPREASSSANVVRFSGRPAVHLDEAVSIYLIGNSVRHATSSDMTDPANPLWSAANEIGKNVVAMTFTYFDSTGIEVVPGTLNSRLSISRIDIRLTVETATPLSNGARPSFSLALRTIPRNVRIRSAR